MVFLPKSTESDECSIFRLYVPSPDEEQNNLMPILSRKKLHYPKIHCNLTIVEFKLVFVKPLGHFLPEH